VWCLLYGAGAVGLVLGSFLHAAGAEVGFVARAATVLALRRAGLERRGRFGAHRAAPGSVAAGEALAALAGGADLDFVLATVKSFDSEAAAKDLAGQPGRLGPRGLVGVWQNGWGGGAAVARP